MNNGFWTFIFKELNVYKLHKLPNIILKLLQVLFSLFRWSKQFPAKACILFSVLLVTDYDAYANPLLGLWPLFPVYLITIQLCIWSVYCPLLRKLRMTFITVGTRRLLIICLARKVLRMPCSLYSQGQVLSSVVICLGYEGLRGRTAVTVCSILYSECKQQGALHMVLLKI